MIDVVYLVRPGRRHDELRYSLRSLANLPHGQVWLVGHCPSWVRNVVHVPTEQREGDKGPNMRRGYEAITREGPDEFLLFNDDFYVMHQVERVLPMHRGRLDQLLAGGDVPPGSRYRQALADVAELLPRRALAYDAIHTPMPMTRAGLATALSMWGGHHGLRTIVGNVTGMRGREVRNCKNPDEETCWPEWTYLSTNDRSFRFERIGQYIRSHHRRPSPYEQTQER